MFTDWSKSHSVEIRSGPIENWSLTISGMSSQKRSYIISIYRYSMMFKLSSMNTVNIQEREKEKSYLRNMNV